MLYPNKIRKEPSKPVNYANRGMGLEYLINDTNKYYLLNHIALVYQKPTPIAIKDTKYAENKIAVTGYLKAKSTLDFVGLYQGKYLDFDAKSTKNKTAFPLNNIQEHQINHMQNVVNHGGISFLIIEMNNEYYLLLAEDIIAFMENNERKSLPYEELKKIGHLIKVGLNPKIDYIKVVNEIYFKKRDDE